MTINTTDSVGPRKAPEPVEGLPTINTTAILDDMEYVDEGPEVLSVVSAPGWYAGFADGSLLPLVGWAVLDDDSMHGVILEEGEHAIDATKSVAEQVGFQQYVHETEIDFTEEED